MTELRVALTVADFDEAIRFYRDALGLEQLADWSSETGRVILLGAGRATLELLDEAQAETVDAIEAGTRVSGWCASRSRSPTVTRLRGGSSMRGASSRAARDHAMGRSDARVRAADGMQLTLFTVE